MTAAEFKRKWSRYTGKESSAYQEHFNDLCRLLGHPTPAEADPSGEDFFCFQKGVIKDLETLDVEHGDKPKKGFADVWKKDCFGWEYKGKHKDLGEAYKQLLRYRESLLNPPLLVVCDFDRYIIKTNFNGTVQTVHEFNSAHIDDPRILQLLRHVFSDPGYLRPLQTTAEVTEKLAAKFAAVARSLQDRESVELADAFTRKALHVAQKKNLRIGRFLNRVMFCFFAEDTGLLPKRLFSEIARIGLEDKQQFAEALEQLFRVMSRGGLFGHHKIRHFNGHLFEDVTVFELTDHEISLLAEAAEADWQFIQPSIMGTLFERALDDKQRSQLGAHYTSEADIKTLVEPVLMAPWRREWERLRAEVRQIHSGSLRDIQPGQKLHATATGFKRHSTTLQYNLLDDFVKRLGAVRVLDPACGSGNFLYVALRLLLDLEKEVIAFGTELDVQVESRVGVQQLNAIEINPYAFELAQVSVQIGYLQWRRDNGFDNDRSPVLQNLDGFQNEDALLVPHFRSKARTLKEAQAGEHAGDDALKFYTERDWPKCDVIVSNPPFLGGKLIRRELGDAYVEAVFETYGSRVRPEADLCCYWFEKARKLVEDRRCRRAGLLATQGIRGGANRDTLQRVKESGDIFFAESDRDWVLAGANVHVSMIGFDNGTESHRVLDGKPVTTINANLSATVDITAARPLKANAGLVFMGDTKGGAFDLTDTDALAMMREPNPHGQPNSDVLVPWANGLDVTRRSREMWIVDFGPERAEAEASAYAAPFGRIKRLVQPFRAKNKRDTYRELWWRHVEVRPGMLAALAPLPRFLVTTTVSKYRLFLWLSAPTLPDHQLIVAARANDYFFGILHSRFHEVWGLKQGTRLETRPRYTPTTCFETFPFPFPDDLHTTTTAPIPPSEETESLELNGGMANMVTRRFLKVREEPPPYLASKEDHRVAIAAAAKELNALRERWLNPPEWTETRYLEFPGTVGGPWDRYIVRQDSQDLQDAGKHPVHPVNPVKGSIGLVRYPRLEPRDADCAAKLKKRTLTSLYNERPAWLDLAHQKLDAPSPPPTAGSEPDRLPWI